MAVGSDYDPPSSGAAISRETASPRRAAFIPSDPLFSSQWHFAGTAAVDLNITDAWGYFTGVGVSFGVYDDGVDSNHVDLAAIYDASLHVTVNGVFDDPTIYNSGDAHGTAVAGLIVSVQGNGQGGVGGSFNGRITGVDIFGAGGYSYAADAMNEQDRFDVTNHSWGQTSEFDDNQLSSSWSTFFLGLQDAAANGRSGLGTIQMVAAGNGREEDAEDIDNTNTSNFTSSRFVNTIAGISYDGEVASYSTPGASLLVASPTDSIVTTDYTGSEGYDSGDYTSTFDGTSAATPIASGVVGLMLEANGQLAYRDVMEILAITARQIGNPAGSGYVDNLRPWAFNGASNWNNGGLHFSHDYGFGLIDAFAAVKLAESWNLQQTYANELSTSESNTSSAAVPDDNATGISRAVNLTPASGDPITIEAIEVQIDWVASYGYSGDLVVELISPTGMTSYLLDRAGGSIDLPESWVFTTRAHLGELATGTWTVRVTDLDRWWDEPDTRTITSITVRAYGSNDVGDNYYYTDEFGVVSSASAARRTLTDTDGGIDTINLAALSTGASINLNSGVENVVAGSSFVIAAGTTIENVIGSWSDDTIIGDTSNNILNGNAGNDSLSGGTGNDYLNGGIGNDSMSGGLGDDDIDGSYGLADVAVVDAAYGAVETRYTSSVFTVRGSTSTVGTDTLENIENIQLLDATIETAWFSKTDALTSAQSDSLVELYIASFNRAPDAIGLNYWGGRLYDGMTLPEIARSFFVQPETVAAYPSTMPTQTFVTTVYNNVLSRAPDTEGQDYWVREIDTGSVSRDVFLLAIINGAKASTGSTTDRQTLANKVSVGNHFAFDSGLNNTTWGIDVMDSVTHLASTFTDANALTNRYWDAISTGASSLAMPMSLMGIEANEPVPTLM